jgi:predicted nucleic acid-binding protein
MRLQRDEPPAPPEAAIAAESSAFKRRVRQLVQTDRPRPCDHEDTRSALLYTTALALRGGGFGAAASYAAAHRLTHKSEYFNTFYMGLTLEK